MGFKFSFSAEVPVRKSPGTDGQGARYRPPSYFIPPHQKGRADSKNGENRCSHTHSEVWTVRRPGCIKLESERGPVHFHMLFLDGVYTRNRHGKTRFQRTIAPNQQELAKLIHTISHRVARFLERQGILERDEENSYLQLDGIDEDPMQQLIGCSVSYRIALGPQQGRKVFTLQTLPSVEEDDRYAQVAKEAGFSLHAGVAAQAWERDKLERLCRYISRPAVSEKRLSLTSAGNIRYDVNGLTSVAGAGMRRSDPAQNTLQRRHDPCGRSRASMRFSAFVHPCTSYLNRWISYRNWPHWYRNRESI